MSAVGEIARAVLRPPARVAERAAIDLLEAALASPALERAVNLVLDSPLVERALTRALQGPLVEVVARDLTQYAVIERAVEPLLADAQAERVVARVIESSVLDEAVARLLESKDLWLLVDEVARSPSVTEAISHQSVGFAEEMAGVVRDRSRRGDARIERAARRLLRREAPAGGHDA